MTEPTIAERLEALRAALRAENISMGELAELADLAPYIGPGDVELLEPAGVPEELAYLPIAERMAAMRAPNLVRVTFDWSDEFGECYECGRPAAYDVEEPRLTDAARKRCSVCAALAASEGTPIRWLFAGEGYL